jgi:hypothetical protein
MSLPPLPSLGLGHHDPELGAHSLRPPKERLLLRSVRLKRARRLDLDYLLLPPCHANCGGDGLNVSRAWRPSHFLESPQWTVPRLLPREAPSGREQPGCEQ